MPFWKRRKKPTSTATYVTESQSPQREEGGIPQPTSISPKLFFKAVNTGNLESVKDFIDKGADKETRDKDGHTALHCCSMNGQLEMVKYLIETCHVDTEAKTNYEWTALHLTCKHGHYELVKYLIETGHVDTKVDAHCGITTLQLASAFGNFEIVKYLVETCRLNQQTQDMEGRTALHWASDQGHLEIVKYLKERCDLDAEARNNVGWTPLHFASAKGHLEVVKYFIEICHVDKEAKTTDGRTACTFALNNNRSNVVEYFQEKWTVLNDENEIDLTQESGCGGEQMPKQTTITPEMALDFLNAVQDGNLALVKDFVDKGVDVEKVVDVCGSNALHCASWKGHLHIVKYLIETCHANKNAKNHAEYTALHQACVYGHLDIIKYLIESCHVDRHIKTKNGFTEVHSAVRRGRVEIVKYLIDTCDDINKETESSGYTVLHRASFYGKLDIVKYLIETRQVNKEAKAKNGMTALLVACELGHVDVVKYLIETCRVDQEVATTDAWSPLHFASNNGHLEIVKYLVETCRVDQEAATTDGQTACTLALKNSKGDVVEYLQAEKTAVTPELLLKVAGEGKLDLVTEYINKGVDKEVKWGHEGMNALHTASRYGHLHVVQYLIEICHANKDATASYDYTAIHYASSNGRLDIVKYLIGTCGVDKETKAINGLNPLHSACQRGHMDIIQYLIETCHVDKEATDIYGCNALYLAIYRGQLQVTKYLIEACQVEQGAKTNNGMTALLVASELGHLNVIKYLTETWDHHTDARNNDGWTPLHFACNNGHFEIVKYLVESCRVDQEVKSNDGQTAYELALKSNKSNVVEYMQAKKTDATIHDEIEIDLTNANGYEGISQYKIDSAVALSSADQHQSPVGNFGASNTNPLVLISHPSTSFTAAFELNETWMLSLKDENQLIANKLSQLDSSIQFIEERRDLLDLIVVEKCTTIDEQNEQSAILASPKHRDFYLLLQRKLKCMITSCETLSTGMVGPGGGDLRQFIAQTIASDNGCNILKETKFGFFIASAVEWAKKNFAVVPFIDTVGSIFQVILALKDEHDRYVGLARVSDFATMVCLPQFGTTSLDSAVEKLARLIVRARCGSPSCKFIEAKDEFGRLKQLMINLLAASGNTPAKEQASEAADCAFAHIMKSNHDSILSGVLNDSIRDAGLAEALAATILGMDVQDLKKLDPVSVATTNDIQQNNHVPNTFATAANDSNDVQNNTTTSVSTGTTFHSAAYASSDLVAAQETKLQKQEEMIQKQNEIIQQLSRKMARLEKSADNNDSGGGTMHARPEEVFRNEIAGMKNLKSDVKGISDEVTTIEYEVTDHNLRILILEERLKDLEHTATSEKVHTNSRKKK